MRKQGTLIEKSGGRRISLYAELGRYFTADGGFDEKTFRKIIQDSLNDAGGTLPTQEGRSAQGKWLSSYLSEIMDYLSEKGMPEAASHVCRAAVALAASSTAA
ncbi:MAG TPA: hypothetical protein PLB81_04215, partial [Deltaproteobacteria bacterium]|nr:hypothetical protein [Deltaproteobacteria bacterium]